MRLAAILTLALLVPAMAFAATKELTCSDEDGTGSYQVVLDESAGTVLVTYASINWTEPLAKAEFTDDMVTWTYYFDGNGNSNNAFTNHYSLNRMTGVMTTKRVEDSRYNSHGQRVETTTTHKCSVSEPKF